MPRFFFRFTAACVVAIQLPVPMVQAAASDYDLTLVQTTYPVGSGAVLDVRLTNKRTNTPVKDAVIFTTRMDMEPDGMEMMTSPIVVLPTDEPGLYRFSTDLTMAGNWRFSIAAKVQGEAETVQAQILLQAQP